MKVVFEQEFGKVWTDNLSPVVFTLITEVPSTPSAAASFFEAQVSLAKDLFKKYKEAYLVSDFSQTTREMRDQLCNYYLEYVPTLVKNKISYIALVCPRNAFDSLPDEKKAKLQEVPLGVYETFVDGLTAVNTKRSGELSKKLQGIL